MTDSFLLLLDYLWFLTNTSAEAHEKLNLSTFFSSKGSKMPKPSGLVGLENSSCLELQKTWFSYLKRRIKPLKPPRTSKKTQLSIKKSKQMPSKTIKKSKKNSIHLRWSFCKARGCADDSAGRGRFKAWPPSFFVSAGSRWSQTARQDTHQTPNRHLKKAQKGSPSEIPAIFLCALTRHFLHVL